MLLDENTEKDMRNQKVRRDDEAESKTSVPGEGILSKQLLSHMSEEGEQEPEVTLEQIKEAHKENDLELNLSSIRTASDYMKKVEFKVPLNQLYEVVASCYDTEGADYCGILVRIVDKTILSLNHDLPYLLQVFALELALVIRFWLVGKVHR